MIETRRSPWWTAPAVLLCAFALLLWQVVSHGFVTRVDVHVRDGIQDAATSGGLRRLAPVGRDCANLGNETPAILVLLAAALFAAWRAHSRRPLLLALGAGIVLASVIPLKIWVDRPGPGQAVLGNADLGFFPSGHTADALCCYLPAAFLLASFVWTGAAVRRWLSGLVLAVLVLTVFGLLWANYHWLSDIVGSFCWCGAWLLVLRHYTDRQRPQART